MYFVWALLPLTFFIMSLWSVYRRRFQDHKKDHPKFYANQGIFCLIILLVAIGLDRTLFNHLFLAEYPAIYLDDDLLISIMNWFLYPVVLLLAAIIQSKITGEGKKKKK
jgi:hypothetical protein